jgi:protein-tyrosine phosphatase
MNSAAQRQSNSSNTSAAIVPEVDLHCHILPDWDDGPATLEESLAMARRGAELGLKKILVTPHVGRTIRGREKPSREIPGATEKLQGEINRAGIPIELVPGADLSLSAPELIERVTRNPWMSVGGQGKYILLESPFNEWPAVAEKMLYQIALTGVTIIIAHPERYVNVQKDLSIMEAAVQQGALLQITARSFIAPESRPVHKTAVRMLESGMVSIIASDAHTPAGAHIKDAVDFVTKAIGEEQARQIFVENPKAILEGDYVVSADIRPQAKKQGFLAGLFRR